MLYTCYMIDIYDSLMTIAEYHDVVVGDLWLPPKSR